MNGLDYINIKGRVTASLSEASPIVERTSGICEWVGKYSSCGDCEGAKLNCESYLGRDYSE